MKFEILSFANGANIPAEFAFCKLDENGELCSGSNNNPHILWGDLPEGTRSLALICFDPDVPSIKDNVNKKHKTIPVEFPRADFFHWVLINITPGLYEIPAGYVSDRITPRGKACGESPFGLRGSNSYTDWFSGDQEMEGVYGGYDGPCPPWNDKKIHHYQFTLFALDINQLPLHGNFNGWDVRDAMKRHILAQADWTGTYTLNKNLL